MAPGTIKKLAALLTCCVLMMTHGLPAGDAAARTIVWVRSSDALTLDPHAANEGPTHTLNHHIYEPLVIRDSRGKLRPALAMQWRVQDDPKIWTFDLRPGVTFHDGTPMTADDVIFSIERAQHPNSDVKARVSAIAKVTRLDTLRIQIETKGRNPLLPMQLSDIFIMSKAWATTHGVQTPPTPNDNAPHHASTHANGTGPFIIVSREPGKETRMRRNPNYWEPLPDITELVFRSIPSNDARLAVILEGKFDFAQDVPITHLAELGQKPDITLKSGPENRVLFLGLNVTPHLRAPPVEPSDAPATNPMQDRRVRMALDLALDRKAIQNGVMKGQSIPTGVVAPPTINGYPQQLDRVAPPDREQAKQLLKEAGFEAGFEVHLDCPNDRYVNDAGICLAISEQLKSIGVTAHVKLRSKTEHFPLLRNGQSDMYLLGWGVPTFDSEYVFRHLFHSVTEGRPAWNGTGYSNPKTDADIESLATETDLTNRNHTIADIWWRVHAERIYVPIHVQTITYAMRNGFDIDVHVSDTPMLKFARLGTARDTPPRPN
jgi:peptide/nickel transport system substrate-binding protein